MLKRTLIVTTALIMTCASLASAEDIDGGKFRDIDEGSWYHPIEIDSLITSGANEQELYQTLARIENGTGQRWNPEQPDTIIEYGNGNWTYEFVAAGDAAISRGDYNAAITYYHTGAAPHIGTAGQDEALEMARAAYAQAMKSISFFEEIEIAYDGLSFTAYLHIPEGDGPFPVLVMSNGSDMSSVATLGYYTDHLLPKGIAFLTLDIPGMGRSSAYDVTDGATEKLHVATINWAKSDERLDNDNIFMQGISFAGNSAARIFTQHEDLDLAGVVYTCGPLNAAFMAPPAAYAHFPQFTIDGVKARLGLPRDASFEEFANRARILSLETIAAFEGDPISTPILAINTNDDPVAPVDEMDQLLSRGTEVNRVIFDQPGHCPSRQHREAIASAWIVTHIR